MLAIFSEHVFGICAASGVKRVYEPINVRVGNGLARAKTMHMPMKRQVEQILVKHAWAKKLHNSLVKIVKCHQMTMYKIESNHACKRPSRSGDKVEDMLWACGHGTMCPCCSSFGTPSRMRRGQAAI